jgi:cytochrome c oxidase cbb3-type subunit I
MSEPLSPTEPAEISASCRVPLLLLFVSAAKWLVIGSAFALISSLSFHNPDMFAGCAWLAYGRAHPVYINAMLYGFCMQAGLGVALWLLARLGRTALVHGWLVTVGALFWNAGVVLGVVGILIGDSTGFENLELPGYATPFLSLGYLLVGLCAALTFHYRRERALSPAQWFLLAALFWFPWIYSTAELLLVQFPVRGVAQSAIAWWYSQNFQVVWLSLTGLAAVYYFVPKFTNRELNSRHLALFTFWTLLLFVSWGGIPNSAPLPAWMPTLSSIATVLSVLPLLSVAVTIWFTAGCLLPKAAANVSSIPNASTSLQFISFGVLGFLLAGLMRVLGALLPVSEITDLTWFSAAQTQLHFYGFFSLVMFGALYHIVPQLFGLNFLSARLSRAHLWLAALGILLIAVPLAVAGVVQGLRLQHGVPFLEIAKGNLMFLRASTMGDLLLGAGHVFFLVNLARLVVEYYRAQAAAAYADATVNIRTAEVKP